MSIRREEEDEEDPDVEDIKNSEICVDNHASCINDKIDAVLEVFDNETCLGLLTGYYQVYRNFYLEIMYIRV